MPDSNVLSAPFAGTAGAPFAVDLDASTNANWPVGKTAWGALGSAYNIVDDVEGKRLPVKVGDPVQGALTDVSITSLSGSSQQLVGALSTRRYLMLQNIGNAQVGVNLAGAAAAIGGSGTYTLYPGGTLLFEGFVPTNVINVIGTAAQPLNAWYA
jgi:hypothetical protein